jgi:membrane dipeptidase
MSTLTKLVEAPLVWDNVWPLEPEAGNDYASLRRHGSAGVDIVSITIAGDRHNISQAMQRTAAARRAILADPESFRLVGHLDDVWQAKRERKLGVILHFEGTRCFERDLAVVEAFYCLGVKQTLLVFNTTNSAGGGCADAVDGGLTVFGRQLVREMQRVGMLVDLSHTGYRTSRDALELAASPCVFSHSNAYAEHAHPRNVHDDQIRACAATGGLVGVSGSSEYLGDDSCSTDALFRHVDHIAQLVGPAHVGLGLDLVSDAVAVSDFARSRPEEWPFAAVPGWKGFQYAKAEQIEELAHELAAHGYSQQDVNGIFGGNYLRICREVWR